jgi:hypothetical protein
VRKERATPTRKLEERERETERETDRQSCEELKKLKMYPYVILNF